MTDIIYPTLDLFLYDLRNGLGNTEMEVKQIREKFKQKLPATVGDEVFAGDNIFEAEYIELLDPNRIGKRKTKRFHNPTNSYKGYYYPVCINDAYGLLVDCSVDDLSAPQPAECFANLKVEIEQNQLQGEQPTIGQTWMIYGWLPEGTKKTPAEIAEACYKALMPSGKWEKHLQGKFLGADIFEISKYDIVMKEKTQGEATIQDIQDNQHIIAIIYPDVETASKSAGFLSEWMKLFLYRHKVLWGYGQSRVLKKHLKSYFAIIEEGQSEIKKGLAKGRELASLKERLQILQESFDSYTMFLRKLDLIKEAIDINLGNYRLVYVGMEKKAQEIAAEADTDLQFFDKFESRFREKYRQQIMKDRINMRTGMTLLQEVISVTKSRVDAEKAARDQNFQEVLTNMGVGWAVGSFVAEQQPQTKEPIPKPFSLAAINYYTTLLVPPVTAAIGASLFFWLIKRLLERSEKLSQLFKHTVDQLKE
ncbi:MAG: hypothetical protein AB4352_14650 [Hormoscilla sp.]